MPQPADQNPWPALNRHYFLEDSVLFLLIIVHPTQAVTQLEYHVHARQATLHSISETLQYTYSTRTKVRYPFLCYLLYSSNMSDSSWFRDSFSLDTNPCPKDSSQRQ